MSSCSYLWGSFCRTVESWAPQKHVNLLPWLSPHLLHKQIALDLWTATGGEEILKDKTKTRKEDMKQWQHTFLHQWLYVSGVQLWITSEAYKLTVTVTAGDTICRGITDRRRLLFYQSVIWALASVQDWQLMVEMGGSLNSYTPQ